MSKRNRSKKKGSTQLKKPASPTPLPETVASPVIEEDEEHIVDTTAELDEAQAALDALTAQLSELETLSQETEAKVANISTDYHRSQLELESDAGDGTMFRDHRDNGPAHRAGERIAGMFESVLGRFVLIGGLSLFAIGLMGGLIALTNPDLRLPVTTPAPVGELPIVAMGQSVELHGVQVELTTWQIGGFDDAKGVLPGELVVVELSLKNASDKEVSLDALLQDTDLVDEQNRVLGHLVRDNQNLLEVQVPQHGDKTGAGLAPGASQTLRLVFRAGADASTFRMEIRGEKPCRIPLTHAVSRPRAKRVA